MNRSSINRSDMKLNGLRRFQLLVLLFASLLSILAADTAVLAASAAGSEEGTKDN